MKNKSYIMLIFIIILFIINGVLAILKGVNLTDLIACTLVLFGFAGSYLWSENKRPSEKTNILTIDGIYSKRESIMYIVILTWFFSVILSIILKYNLNELSAYFGALIPFISGFIIIDGNKKE